ncbi:3145_t:CDS:2 [Gigaspora margarita]|uniref:3145_t:CDS:1 n=1 Tax=Gigaspora margarita TaxID=4874 RepID=A0ABN7VN50_GIGMA|nr:3145_t:CDS:2 [Gigaspora margarita]
MSRVEGAHATLKKYLQVSTGDLYTVYEKISLLLENQYNKIKAMISKDETRLPCAHIIQEHLTANQILSIDNVYHHWWIEGLKLPLQSQLRTTENSLIPLFQEFTQEYNSWPIPQQVVAQNRLVEIIKEPPMLLSDPIVQQTRERLVSSQNKSNKAQASTKRNPSAFELEEAQLSGRKCGICKKLGHNSRTCHESSSATEI